MRHGKARSAKPTERHAALATVGIGASAGGLDAFKKLFTAMPADSGAAFVLIQHLDPTRDSLTADLVGRYTRMRVVQAEDEMRVAANHVYVIPPNKYLSIRQGTLHLSAPSEPRTLRMAIDFFLRSLAADQHERAIGIILSGTGSDGALGLKEIRAAGGMTMVQDPATAQHDGMARSAIASGSADYILPAEQMADAVLKYVHQGYLKTGGVLPEKDPDPLASAVALLHTQTTHDFSGYKLGTLRRRIERRMSLKQVDRMAVYVELLRSDPTELAALFKDLLINVTSFFRDPAAWRILLEQVIRQLVAQKDTGAPIRVWVPACATGEEVYSIVMLLIEEVRAAGKTCPLQVFASDIDAEALQVARAGVYPESIAADVPLERLSRFFIPGAHGYQVIKELRDAVVFAQQNLLSDPPFSQLDLISCRNLLIYLEPPLQHRIITFLHFVLVEGGYLLLGSAEGIAAQEDLFEVISTKWRIYRRIGATQRAQARLPLATVAAASLVPRRTSSPPIAGRLATRAHQSFLERYAPAPVAAVPRASGDPDGAAAALVDQLEHELTATKEDLRLSIEDLRSANEELMSVNEELQSSNEELETSKEELQSLNEELTTSNAELEGKITELEGINNDLDNLLSSTNIATLFLDTRLCIRRFTPATTQLFSLIASDVGRPISDLTQKFSDPALLSDAAAVLQQAMTPKTEVQAQDGKWYVRQVLPYRTRGDRIEGVVITFSDVAAEALQKARLYAESIVQTVREPLLVLDGDLRVRSANQSFYATFRVSAEETVGQLLYELGNRQWDIPELRALLSEVLPQKHVLNDFEVKHDFESMGPGIMLLNARALLRGGDRPDLILLAIEDITGRKHAQEALRENEARKQAEEQVRQRQAELAHALRISTVGELASGLAHELNQPLSAIANGVEACARYVRAGKVKSKKLLALLDDASAEALRAGDIVEHLRSFIQKGEPQFEPTDLREIARGIPRLLGREIQQEQVSFELDLKPQRLPIHADRIQIEQIIVNLMQNAIDAVRETPGGRREIQLRARAVNGMAEVSVRDSGPGVSAAASERLFEPFFTTKPKGLGMGLAISRSVLEAHRGRIWVEPPGRGGSGTTVRFTLPLQPRKPARKGRSK